MSKDSMDDYIFDPAPPGSAPIDIEPVVPCTDCDKPVYIDGRCKLHHDLAWYRRGAPKIINTGNGMHEREIIHGRASNYARYVCRCEECTNAHRIRCKLSRARRLERMLSDANA